MRSSTTDAEIKSYYTNEIKEALSTSGPLDIKRIHDLFAQPCFSSRKPASLDEKHTVMPLSNRSTPGHKGYKLLAIKKNSVHEAVAYCLDFKNPELLDQATKKLEKHAFHTNAENLARLLGRPIFVISRTQFQVNNEIEVHSTTEAKSIMEIVAMNPLFIYQHEEGSYDALMLAPNGGDIADVLNILLNTKNPLKPVTFTPAVTNSRLETYHLIKELARTLQDRPPSVNKIHSLLAILGRELTIKEGEYTPTYTTHDHNTLYTLVSMYLADYVNPSKILPNELLGNMITPTMLRKAVNSYIEHNWEALEGHRDPSALGAPKTIYLNFIKNNSPGDLEILALMRLLGRPIVIIDVANQKIINIANLSKLALKQKKIICAYDITADTNPILICLNIATGQYHLMTPHNLPYSLEILSRNSIGVEDMHAILQDKLENMRLNGLTIHLATPESRARYFDYQKQRMDLLEKIQVSLIYTVAGDPNKIQNLMRSLDRPILILTHDKKGRLKISNMESLLTSTFNKAKKIQSALDITTVMKPIFVLEKNGCYSPVREDLDQNLFLQEVVSNTMGFNDEEEKNSMVVKQEETKQEEKKRVERTVSTPSIGASPLSVVSAATRQAIESQQQAARPAVILTQQLTNDGASEVENRLPIIANVAVEIKQANAITQIADFVGHTEDAKYFREIKNETALDFTLDVIRDAILQKANSDPNVSKIIPKETLELYASPQTSDQKEKLSFPYQAELAALKEQASNALKRCITIINKNGKSILDLKLHDTDTFIKRIAAIRLIETKIAAGTYNPKSMQTELEKTFGVDILVLTNPGRLYKFFNNKQLLNELGVWIKKYNTFLLPPEKVRTSEVKPTTPSV